MDIPVLLPDQTRTVVLDGKAYTLRGLTHGEVSAILMATASLPQPSTTVVRDAIKRACVAAGEQGLADAIDQEDAAQDAMTALMAGRPSALDAVGVLEWERENEGEIRALTRQAEAARRAIQLATYVAGADPIVARLRRELLAYSRADTVQMLAAGLGMTAEAVEALPAGHAAVLSRRLREMANPTEDAAKN